MVFIWNFYIQWRPLIFGSLTFYSLSWYRQPPCTFYIGWWDSRSIGFCATSNERGVGQGGVLVAVFNASVVACFWLDGEAFPDSATRFEGTCSLSTRFFPGEGFEEWLESYICGYRRAGGRGLLPRVDFSILATISNVSPARFCLPLFFCAFIWGYSLGVRYSLSFDNVLLWINPRINIFASEKPMAFCNIPYDS